MMAMLEDVSRLFSRPGPVARVDVGQYQKALEQIALIASNLAQWEDNRDGIEIWEKILEIAGVDSALFRELVTVPLLNGRSNWTGAQKPRHFIFGTMRNRKLDERRKSSRLRRREGRLEEVDEPEFSGETTAGANQSFADAVDAVLARADSEVQAYGRLVFAGYTQPQIRRQFSWSQKHAHRVDVRFRRYLKGAAGSVDIRQALAQLRTDASRTVVRQVFQDPKGERRSYFEHSAGWKTDPKSVN
jgi:DNA-directed RNA polymerase specialized sigma24 family protein